MISSWMQIKKRNKKVALQYAIEMERKWWSHLIHSFQVLENVRKPKKSFHPEAVTMFLCTNDSVVDDKDDDEMDVESS